MRTESRSYGEPDVVVLQSTLYSSNNPTRRWLHQTRRAKIRELIEALPGPKRHALEVGPGSGVYLPTLCSLYESVTAIDLEPRHLQFIESSFQFDNLTLSQGDLTEMNWESPFDLVLCSEVIEHVPSPKAFMQGLRRSVRQGGALILSTPQRWSTLEITAGIGLSPILIGLVRRIYREPVLPTGHISLMTRAEVCSLLHDNGFRILRTELFGLYFPVLAEFGGDWAVRSAQILEPLVRRLGPFLLWTQLHLATKE